MKTALRTAYKQLTSFFPVDFCWIPITIDTNEVRRIFFDGRALVIELLNGKQLTTNNKIEVICIK